MARRLHHVISLVERALGRAATDFIGEKLPASSPTDDRRASQPGALDYPGDFRGIPPMEYAPNLDGAPDPGEVVWTWVPYEEDHRQGKDRPVLLLGHDGPWLLAVPLTSKDHHRDAAQEHAAGRDWVDIGSGAWDSRGRPSEVRINRIVRVDPGTVRREGAILPKPLFDRVSAAITADVRRQR